MPQTGADQLPWIGDIPSIGARRHPDRPALINADRGVTLTYAEFDRRCDAFVALLKARGIAPGDRIAWLGKNSDVFFVAMFGAIRAGVVLVSINWRLAPPEVGYILKDSGAKLLLRDDELTAAVNEACKALPAAPATIATDTDGDPACVRALTAASAPHVDCPHDLEQAAIQLYTSGTTGMPKGVLISHRGLSLQVQSGQMLPEFVSWGPDDVSLTAMPNFHIGGIAWALIGLARLAPVVVTANLTPQNLIRLIREHGANHTFMVPTVVRAIVDQLHADPVADFPLKSIHYGAAPIGESLLEDAMRTLKGVEFGQHFGMTEVTGSCTYLTPSEHDPKRPQILKSVGRPLPGCAIEIRDPENTRVLACGEHGEIWVKSPMVMRGYWNQPQKTAEALVDGWYRSGDGGYLDEDGFLYLTDRIKDMIISGGENVYPNEVEEVLRHHPAVLDAGVIGLPDPRWGERVSALVELRPGQSVTEDELAAFTRQNIAAFKCPKTIHFGPLPRTASGKVQRAQIRKSFNN
ncbi:MAG TPA: long-chain-fatty-acid--CoA ligase [Nevskiaceae bacterium]|nr:long-chain-fatty-acid--CoA ligase [Nevskiaceae bacterium]